MLAGARNVGILGCQSANRVYVSEVCDGRAVVRCFLLKLYGFLLICSVLKMSMAMPGARAPVLRLDSSAMTLGGEKTSDISGYHTLAFDVSAGLPIS